MLFRVLLVGFMLCIFLEEELVQQRKGWFISVFHLNSAHHLLIIYARENTKCKAMVYFLSSATVLISGMN